MMDSICLPFNALLVVAFPLFLLSSHLSLLSAKSDFSSCSAQQRQFCGNLNISYPFFNQSNWGCALEALRCRSSFTPGINSWVENEESTYEFQRIDYTNKTVLAHDRRFTRDSFLNDNDKCNALFNNFTMPPIFFSHLLAEVISPNLTLRVCKQRHQQEFNGSNDCKVEVLSDVADAPAPAPPSPLDSHGPPYDDCKLIYLPVDVPTNNSTIFHGRVDRVSQLFTAGFRLRWSLPKQCPQCDNGTVCLLKHHHQDNENFFCFDPEKGNKSHWLFIGIGIAAGILFPCLFFFVIYRYRTGHTHGVCIFSSNTDLESGSTHFGVPIFSYAELEEATNNFSSVNELGNGGFGTVYHGKLRDGRVVAIKHLYHNHYKQVELFMNEIEILTRLRHQNLVTLYGCTSNHSRELLLVYEFIPNGTIADHLHGDRTKVGSLTWPVRLSIAIETARALSYLHASDIIHRDVKTSNILLDNHFHVKVADFGLSRLFPTDVSHISTAPQGTPGYVDPEYHRCYQLTDKSDVYSFGVVLIELMSSKPAVDISRHRDEINLAYMAMNKIQNGALQDLVDPCLRFESDCATRGAVTLVAELAFRCLQHEKEVRPSMEEVVEILMAIGGEDEYKVVDNAEVMDILASYDIELLPKNMTPPPPPSPDTGTDKLINQSTMPSTSG